ncbi:Spy/CpxP family protein refolding chaperone [Acaryochloris sp. IP29b_bin.137]|uniref:Spy/CpxP family protein refolding chaperone n=1 Tax=Acaryochloris sp. IP29b_bin.137 TaxID=2969217 RepID=UPI00261AA977|nr:Spy/CpxP family protein refolding chaperone [Acaryochloris sp. IP29b_bin.137]
MKFRPIYLLAALPLLIPVGHGLTAGADSLLPRSVVAQESSEPDKPNKEERRQRRKERFRQELNLTPEQVEQIEQIRATGKEGRQGKREEFRAARDRMQALMAGDASDDDLRSQYQILQDLRREMKDARFEKKLKIRQVLTPEQRQKMVELKKQRKRRWGHHKRRHQEQNGSQSE